MVISSHQERAHKDPTVGVGDCFHYFAILYSKLGLMVATIGADLISTTVPHALDPLCFLLGKFSSLVATASTVLPNVQYAREDESKPEPAGHKFVDPVGRQGVPESGALVSFALTTTIRAIPESGQWIIKGEEGPLEFEAPSPFRLTPPTLYQYTPYEEGGWEIVNVASTSIDELYATFC